MGDESANRARHLARNTLLVAFSFGLAAVAGFFRNALIARQFGIGADLDTYYAAFKLPDLLFTVVAGGALATAFIPVFAERRTAVGDGEAWQLASAVLNWAVLIVACLAAVAALFAPQLVRLLVAPGFDAAQQAETASLMRLVLVSSVVFAASSVLGSALHGVKHFLLPALAPVVYPLGIAAGALWLAPIWGIRGLAVGALLGAVLHLLVKLPALLRFGFRWRPVLDPGSGAVRRVAMLVGPRVLDLGLFHLTVLVTTNLASRLGSGAVSALEWGWDAMQLPETIIGTAFGLVAFPTLADLAARGDREGMRRTVGESTRTILAVAVPAAAGLILLGPSLIALLYERGAFDSAASTAVSGALRLYALGLAGHACLEIAARAFFAQQDTLTPLAIAAGSALLNILLAVALMPAMGYRGLALANSVAITLEVIVLLLVLRGRWGHIEGRQTAGRLLRILAATALMSAVIAGTGSLSSAAGWGRTASLAVQLIAGAATYLVACAVLGVDDLWRFVRAAARFPRAGIAAVVQGAHSEGVD